MRKIDNDVEVALLRYLI